LQSCNHHHHHHPECHNMPVPCSDSSIGPERAAYASSSTAPRYCTSQGR
jgi:hypothetical protein